MKKKIVIIGNGKLAKSLVEGFLRAQIPCENIILIKPRKNSNVDWFSKKGIHTSDDYYHVYSADYILLAVTPAGSAPTLKSIHACRGKQLGRDAIFISFVSGLSITRISTALHFHLGNIIRATTNTNIAYNKGIICASAVHNGMVSCKSAIKVSAKLLQLLGIVIEENTKELTKSITTVGSMNAIDATALKISYLQTIESDCSLPAWSFRSWLTHIFVEIDAKKSFSPTYATVHIYNYLKAKEEALVAALGYSPTQGKLRSLQTLKSTIEALLSHENITTDSVEELITTVVTKGGCTEQGIGRITAKKLQENPVQLLTEVFTIIHRRAKKFNFDVKKSFF